MFELNGREQAILLWIAIGVVAGLLKRDVRRAAFGVLKAFLHPKILQWVIGMLAWTAVCVVGLHAIRLGHVSLWEPSNLKTTVVWVLTFALVTMLNVNELSERRGSIGKLALDAVAPTAWVVFVGTLYTFNFWVELVLVPFVVALGALLAVAQYETRAAILVKPLQTLLALSGLVMMGYSLLRIGTGFDDFAKADTFREFTVPVALTLAFLPFFALMGALMAYESAFVGLQIRRPDKATHRYAVLRAAWSFRLDKELLRRFVRDLQLGDVYDRRAVDEVIRDVRLRRKREQNPKSVPANLGWSPFEAGRYLAGLDLVTRDYHPAFGTWSAESPSRNLGEHGLDRLTYGIAGDEFAATRLTLRLDARGAGEAGGPDRDFWEAVTELAAKVLEADEARRAVARLRGRAQRFRSRSGLRLELSKDSWGDAKFGGYSRQLVIKHPADNDPFDR